MDANKAQGSVVGNDPNEGHGKQTGLVHAPIKSMAPVSNKGDWGNQEFKIIENANQDDNTKDKFYSLYPFAELELGQGFFVPNKPEQSTDKNVEQMYKQVATAREYYAEVERDKDGDEILEQIIVKERKKNADGTFQLDGENKVITGANSTSRPKLIGNRNFIVRGVAKGYDIGNGKAPADGVLVIRV